MYKKKKKWIAFNTTELADNDVCPDLFHFGDHGVLVTSSGLQVTAFKTLSLLAVCP